MKNIDTVKYCKSCNFSLTGGVSVPPEIQKNSGDELKSINSDAAAGTVDSKSDEPSFKNIPHDINEKKADANIAVSANKEDDFSDLISSGHETDSSAAETIEIVSKNEEPAIIETSHSKEPYYKNKSAVQSVNVNIIEEKEPKRLFNSNFQRNILPRLLQIFFIGGFLTFIAIGIYVYWIMELPEYYDTFHMRVESSKNFYDTITQLNVAENARKNPRLQMQYDEIKFNYLHKYVKWHVYVLDYATFPDNSKVIISSKKQLKDVETHKILLHLSKDFRLRNQNLKVTANKTLQIIGRIISWKRDNATNSFEIQLYNSEIIE